MVIKGKLPFSNRAHPRTQISIRAGPLQHKVPCWGYVVKEADSQGSIDVDLCVAKGLPPGPLYKELKAGRSVTLPNGTMVRTTRTSFWAPSRSTDRATH